jgi:hypothetical protein
MDVWAEDDFVRQLLHKVMPNLSVFVKFTT